MGINGRVPPGLNVWPPEPRSAFAKWKPVKTSTITSPKIDCLYRTTVDRAAQVGRTVQGESRRRRNALSHHGAILNQPIFDTRIGQGGAILLNHRFSISTC
jgi:hypothetical protein